MRSNGTAYRAFGLGNGLGALLLGGRLAAGCHGRKEAAQQELVSLRFARLASQVKLYAALGGGWTGKAIGQAGTR